jgi:hypothetical protein
MCTGLHRFAHFDTLSHIQRVEFSGRSGYVYRITLSVSDQRAGQSGCFLQIDRSAVFSKRFYCGDNNMPAFFFLGYYCFLFPYD